MAEARDFSCSVELDMVAERLPRLWGGRSHFASPELWKGPQCVAWTPKCIAHRLFRAAFSQANQSLCSAASALLRLGHQNNDKELYGAPTSRKSTARRGPLIT